MVTVAVVVNPTKFDDLDSVQAEVQRVTSRLGLADAVWYRTSPEDPGHGQALQAFADGASVVCSLGGDGTVRAVASALAGTDTPLGLLPGGTGNLLARNLGLPIDNLAAAVEVAITGADRRIDVGRVSFDGAPAELFLVMTGMGLDAEAVDADEKLKARIGTLAYVAAGVRALFRKGFRVTLVANGVPLRRQNASMVVIGNCGQLVGGVDLLPDARVDDGSLDAVVAAPEGIVGWIAVAIDVLTGHRRGHPRLVHRADTAFSAQTRHPVPAEIDGDVIGQRRSLEARVDPGSLLVRVPKPRNGDAA